MQDKSEKFSEYSERTETLASDLRLNLSDLPAKIGVSASMFHAYRSGKHPISEKAWRKLADAEAWARQRRGSGQTRLGILPQIATNVTNPNDMDAPDRKKTANSDHVDRRDAALTSARDRDRRLLDGAGTEIVEVVLELEHYLETMVIRDAPGRQQQLDHCMHRIKDFEKWVQAYRAKTLASKAEPES
jgi:hypothetical protein